MGSNPRPPNSNDMPHNSMAMQLQQQQQQKPQTGMVFPQTSVPFSNPNPCMNNNGQPQAMAMPNVPLNQNGLLNNPNQLLQLQNTLLGMAAMINNIGAFQNCVPNLNQAAMFPGNQVSPGRPPGQFYGQNFPRLPQQMNQSPALPNGQFGSLQNMNQFMPLLGPNYNMFGGCANQPPQTMGHQNQNQNPTPQGMGPQNPSLFPNPQFGQVNQNQQNLVPPALDVNVVLAAASQLLQGNSSAPLSTAQPQQNQNLQPFTPSQGNPVTNGQTNTNWKNSPNGQTNNWKNSPNGKFSRNQKGEASQAGFQKSQFHQMKNTQRNFGSPNELKGKGMKNAKGGKFGHHNNTNPAREPKRSLSLTYTEQEIQQWREERRKNHPSKTKTEKKPTEKPSEPIVLDREAKLRRERLKEILAKQAELGIEVAEIPSHYLSDSEKQANGREENKGPYNKRGRFQNKHDKRGRNNKKDWYAKKQKLDHTDSSNTPSLVKKPTLLQKLMSADIKRDKSHLLQAFRFMAMNSYFKDWPEKPLKFPLVLVKENGCKVEVGTDSSPLVETDDQEKTMSENFSNAVENGQDVDDDDDVEDINDGEGDSDDNDNGNCKGNDEEEGEITD